MNETSNNINNISEKGEYYFVVSEEMVRHGANVCSDDERNSFTRILEEAQIYKDAEMTPIFILDQNFKNLKVVAVETFMKKLH